MLVNQTIYLVIIVFLAIALSLYAVSQTPETKTSKDLQQVGTSHTERDLCA